MNYPKVTKRREYEGGTLVANKGVCIYCRSLNTYTIYGGKFDKHQYCGKCKKTSK